MLQIHADFPANELLATSPTVTCRCRGDLGAWGTGQGAQVQLVPTLMEMAEQLLAWCRSGPGAATLTSSEAKPLITLRDSPRRSRRGRWPRRSAAPGREPTRGLPRVPQRRDGSARSPPGAVLDGCRRGLLDDHGRLPGAMSAGSRAQRLSRASSDPGAEIRCRSHTAEAVRPIIG